MDLYLSGLLSESTFQRQSLAQSDLLSFMHVFVVVLLHVDLFQVGMPLFSFDSCLFTERNLINALFLVAGLGCGTEREKSFFFHPFFFLWYHSSWISLSLPIKYLAANPSFCSPQGVLLPPPSSELLKELVFLPWARGSRK